MKRHLRRHNRRSLNGRRRLTFELLECRYVFNGQAVLAADFFDLRENGPEVELGVLANDTFDSDYEGQRLITSVSSGSQGGRIELSEDRRSVLYTPPADFFGTETFVYAVDGAYTAQVTINIASPLTADHFEIPPDGIERELDLLANDPFWSGYAGARQITAVSVGSEGGIVQIAADGRSVRYTPPTDAFGKESFIYVVDEIYRSQVTIEIPPTLKGDLFQLVQHDPTRVFDVLANDPFWSGAGYTGARKITHVTTSQTGATVQIAGDGKSILYTVGDGAGYDSFRYVVDGAYEASVTVYIHRPVRDDIFEVDQASVSFFYDVTLNDVFNWVGGDQADVIDRVTSVTQSDEGGTVAISADGTGILYSAPAGFTGRDRFTYVADGLHEATVWVDVTRPVRDDNLNAGVYQDTPAQVLDVLANDFLGDGYGGPGIITAIGPTASGGTIAIRADGKAILYTPANGYTGEDRFTYTVDGVMQAEVALVVQALAQPDSEWFYPDPNHAPYEIDVLGNDYFRYGYTGPGAITSVDVTQGSGQVSIHNGRILFDPAAAGLHYIHYVVDGQYEASLSVWIYQAVDPDQFVVDQNSASRELNVLANDFRDYHYYYPGTRLITGVAPSQHGGMVTISTDGRSVHYQPPADFYGTDSFTYTVDDFTTATVTVEVIRRVRDDQFRVDGEDGPQRLPVLVNDLFGANYAGPGQITAVSASTASGTVSVGDDGHSIWYTPAAGFSGTDTFIYTVDGALKAEVKVVVDALASDRPDTFASAAAYFQFLLEDALSRYEHLFGQTAWPHWYSATDRMVNMLYADADGTHNHSETNVQVAGVDEGDIVEFDEDYVYMLTDGELVILNAWPAEELSIASRFDIEGRAVAQFLHGDRLTVISQLGGYSYYPFQPYSAVYDTDSVITIDSYRPWQPPLPSKTIVTVIDVSDRTAPALVQRTEMEGAYVDSRGVGDFVYVLANNVDAMGQAPQIVDDDNDPETPGRYETRDEYLARVTANSGAYVEAALPNYTTYGADGEMVRTGLLNMPEDVYRPLVAGATSLLNVVSFNIKSDEPGLTDSSAIYGSGASTVYASLDNFYVFDGDTHAEDGAVTRIVKFDWDPSTGGVEFAATTTVAGTILNQFSIDESGEYLRIATTASNGRSGNWSMRDENLLFVLQEDNGVFEFVGSLQNLALNETIRSVRFLGDRAFVTTFRDVDPLFAVDLSDPASPKAVGHITLPGFTSYMHLVDEHHLLTVGRNTPRGTSGPTQVSLFDISDLSQPRRIAEYTFERFTTSEAEIDHHAFGYFAEHSLLGMPVAQTRVERVDSDGDGYRETRQTIQEHLLAVFSVDVNAADRRQRLVLSGEIKHDTPVRRSGFIGDKLYSIATDSVKVVDVSALDGVLAEVVVENGPEGIFVAPIDRIGYLDLQSVTLATDDSPANEAPTPLELAEAAARAAMAGRLGLEAGAAMLVTTETAAGTSGSGYHFVFQVDERYYLYRADASGLAQLVDDNFSFDQSAAWHAVALATPAATHPVKSPVAELLPPLPPQIPSAEPPAAIVAPSKEFSESSPLPSQESSEQPSIRAVDRALGEMPRFFPRRALASGKTDVLLSRSMRAAIIDENVLLTLASSGERDVSDDDWRHASRSNAEDGPAGDELDAELPGLRKPFGRPQPLPPERQAGVR